MVWSQIKLSLFKTESGRRLFSFLPLLMTNTCNAFRIVILFKERNAYKRRFLWLIHFAILVMALSKHYLETSKIIAVVGLSDREDTTSHRVSKEMQERAIGLFPSTPAAGGQILGETVYASLQEIPFPVDIVDVYRRSEFLPDVARDYIETDAKIFWATIGAGKSRSRRNPSWSWTRRYRHGTAVSNGNTPDWS